jgi:hypothetical protein
MYIRYGVQLMSVVYIILGVLGFLPLPILNPLHDEGVGAHYLFNLLAINTAHNLIHLAIGLTGFWAASRFGWSRLWGKVMGVVLLLVFGVGIAQAVREGYPVDQLLLGIVVLNSPGHALHLATGLLAIYLGVAPVEGGDLANHPT